MANTKVPIEFVDLDSGIVINEGSADVDFRIESDDSTHMLFVDAGNDRVGINEDAPQQTLSVGLTAGTLSGISLTLNDTDLAAFLTSSSTGEVRIGGVYTNYFPTFYSHNSEAMRINTSGNVGIGETSPLGKLHVKTADSSGTADSGADELILENSGDTGMTILSGTSNSGSIRFGDSDDNDNGIIIYNHGSSPYMRFFIGGSEVLQLGTSYIYINGGNGQTFSDYVRTYSKYQLINFSSSTSSTSTTLSGYLTYQFMIDCTFHMGYVGNGAISTHIRVSLCNTYSGLSVSTLHTAYGQSHNSYHTFSISGTGNYNTRQLVITCNPQSGQNASNAAGNAYYGMGV